MNKVTKVNCEGEDYGFVAGGALKGVSGASASEYIKAVVLPEGADLVEGCLLLVTFVNGNTAGFYGTKTIYSSNGTTFYYDQAMTDPVTLPPEDCYIITPVTGNEYLYQAFPVLSVNGVEAPFCDSKGHPFGGAAWNAGDEVTMLYMGDKFVAILATISQVVAGVDIPPTSDAVYNAIADEASSRDDAIAANNTAKGLVSSKTDNAIARWDGTAGKLQNSGVTINDSNVISGGTLNNASNVALALSNGVTCSTAAGTAAKTVSLTGFVLRKGAKLLVNVTNANTSATALTLNVNGTGAKTIRLNGTVTSSSAHSLSVGWYNCYYDGTYWNMESSDNYEVRSARYANNAATAINANRLYNIEVQLSALASSTARKWVAVEKWSWSTSSGYIKYSNGLLIQWGYVVKNTSQDGTETITYPIAYTQIPALNATWIKSGGYTRMNIKSISTTRAVIRNTDGTTNGYTWISIGY